jgi:hypothetical protein
MFHWQRTAAIGLAVVFGLYALWAYWLVLVASRPMDFLSFWAAGRLTLSGHAPLAYNLVAHGLVEKAAAPIQGWLPFPYPPTFLIMVAPFALLPLSAAFGLWIVLTGFFYVFSARRFAPLPYPLVHPAVLVNTWIGQNGFLITGLFASGLSVLTKSPFLGGAILGLISIKPQLGILIPVALLASREWRAIAGAVLSTLLLLSVSYLLFGWSSFQAFFGALPHQAYVISSGQVGWNELASPFAVFRQLRVPYRFALTLQAIIALLAAAVTWRAWARRLPTRSVTLAAATLLVSPYLLTYDSLLLALPMGWFIQNERRPGGVVLLWLLCLLPIISYSGAYKGPSTIPIAAIICLWLLFREEGQASDAALSAS